jgi:hypothetical protein
MTDTPSPISMQKYLSGVDYPAKRDDLIRHAESQGADKDILDQLKRIPDRQYDGPNAVSQAFSKS